MRQVQQYMRQREVQNALAISETTLWRKKRTDTIFMAIVRPVTIRKHVYYKKEEVARYQEIMEQIEDEYDDVCDVMTPEEYDRWCDVVEQVEGMN